MLACAEHIFLAEDDADDADLFKDILTESGCRVQVTVARDGVELIRLLQQATRMPDVIFLDLNMPRKNGLQCLQEIRQKEEWRSVRVIVLSTSSSADSIEAARRLGADQYMIKSASYNGFKASLINCLRRSGEQQPFVVSPSSVSN